MTEQTETVAYMSKTGMIQTHPKCPNYLTIAKAATPAQQNKVGAVTLEMSEARDRIAKGASHCKMEAAEGTETAKETVNIPGLPGVTVEDAKVLSDKKPARRTAPKQSAVKKQPTKLTPAQVEAAVEKITGAPKAAKKTAAKPEPKATKPETPTEIGVTALDLINLFKIADDAGDLPTGAYTAYKLKVRAVLNALGLDEKTNMVEIDIDKTIEAFKASTKGGQLLDSTRRSYIDAFKRAARLFKAYHADPENWNPTAPAERSVASSTGKRPSKAAVRKWALDQKLVTEADLGPNYVPVKLFNAYEAAHAEAK
jgi:hypothetical protein